MTTLRESAQQALEALERADKISGYANNKKVITALRAALAQQAEPTVKESLPVELVVAENATTQQQIEQTPPSDYRRGYWDGFRIGKREGRIEAEDELAQQAEPVEPYCYVYEYDGAFGLHREFYPKVYNGHKPDRTVPLYTAPPQRKPLTQEEIPALAEKAWTPSVYCDAEALLGTDGLVALVRAVEAKHGIKESP